MVEPATPDFWEHIALMRDHLRKDPEFASINVARQRVREMERAVRKHKQRVTVIRAKLEAAGIKEEK